MWNWYNRPGSRPYLSTGKAIVVLVAAGVLVGILFMLLYSVLAPLLFTQVPGQ